MQDFRQPFVIAWASKAIFEKPSLLELITALTIQNFVLDRLIILVEET